MWTLLPTDRRMTVNKNRAEGVIDDRNLTIKDLHYAFIGGGSK